MIQPYTACKTSINRLKIKFDPYFSAISHIAEMYVVHTMNLAEKYVLD